jgi:uncharacterized protein (DUF3820 family)
MKEESLWIIPFGAHRGPVEDAPAHYLRWLLAQEWFCLKFPLGVKMIEKELKFIEDFGEERR